MIFLTSGEKRVRYISEAVIAELKGDPNWFWPIQARIKNGIVANPDKREQVILKWVRSAEENGATIVKEEILKVYDQRINP